MNSQIVQETVNTSQARRSAANTTLQTLSANFTARLYTSISGNAASPHIADLVAPTFAGYAPLANLTWRGPKLTGDAESPHYVLDAELSWIATGNSTSDAVTGVAICDSTMVVSFAEIDAVTANVKDEDVTILYELLF